jgi:membrane fusion protein (multidrug efflux system)
MAQPVAGGAGAEGSPAACHPGGDVLEQSGPALKPVESLQSAPALQREPTPSWNQQARAPAGPPDKQPEPQPVPGDERKPRRRGLLRRRPVVYAIGGLLLPSALGGGYLYVDHITRFQSTDDAFIAARQFSIAPKVSGYITTVPVTDNQHVKTGDVIALIDDRDYRVALAQTEAQVAAAQASIENIDAQLDVQQAQIAANQAQVDQTQAGLVFAQQQAARYQHLELTGYGTVQNSEQYTSQLHQQQAAVLSAQATLNLAKRQVESLKAQRKSAVASLAQAEAQRDQAKLNLSYATVTAAQPGRVVNLGAAVGQFAQPGTDLTMFVPDEIWVTANFKEIQLDRMRPGEQVTLKIDAYPGREIRGHVESVQPGSGTAFSLLPAQNATGNYVKIVQRVPVKIVIDNPPTDVALGPGMSVVPTVRIDPSPSLSERMGRLL